MDLSTALATMKKAIAAAIAGAVVMFLAKNNIIIADELNDAIEVIIGALVAFVMVYFAPKNEVVKK